MVRAAIKAEAETRVARNRARRDKTNRALAALLTAVCHTKPNPRLSGFQCGLGVANRGAGGKGSGRFRRRSPRRRRRRRTRTTTTTTIRGTRVSRTKTTAL